MTADRILAALCDTTLAGVEAYEFGWTFSFSDGATVTTQSIWRALTAHGIAVTSEDHQQQFGLPAPVDAGQRAISVLLGEVTSAELVPVTGDLRISFGSASTLEFLNTSSGYEGWHLVTREGERKAWEMVALGGGGVAMWSPK
jgi:hypothetical protein